MALKGLDIFKLTPKTNCKECGNPTCMAFSMKVAQGAVALDACPHITDDVKAQLAEATAPPMKTITIGDHKLGGETVLCRHEKTFVSKTLFASTLCDCMDDAAIDAVIANVKKVDYDRIGERMYVEFLFVNHKDGVDGAKFVELVKKAATTERKLILNVTDVELAKQAVAVAGECILNGANPTNYEAMNAVAVEAKAILGVSADDLDTLYDTVAAIEKLGNKNLILDCGTKSIKDAFTNAVQIRRAAIKNNDRTFGYPTLVNVGKLAKGDAQMQTALASLFVVKYGSIVVMEEMAYGQALALYGLRQNVFTDPQKPMTVEPGIYPINGAGPDDICATTVDFALTYFVVTGELERSGKPVNLIISNAGGMSVLTAWAAGKLSAGTVAKFFEEQAIEQKINCRKLIIPGKVAVLKGELEAKLPNWEIIVAPNEAVQLVKFMKEL